MLRWARAAAARPVTDEKEMAVWFQELIHVP